MKGDPTFWLLARSSGLLSYGLVTASVLAGLVLKARPFPALKPPAVLDAHRLLSLLSLTALGIHMATLVLDRAVPVSIAALFVPGLLEYRTVWSAVGVVAAEALVLVVASFWLRKRIGTARWRALHWATYPIFVAVTVHGVLAGTDSGQTWAILAYGGAAGAVATATAWRAFAGPPQRRPRPAAARPTPTEEGATAR